MKLSRLAAPLVTCSVLALPVSAYAESYQAYVDTRGWHVESVYDHGQFAGCRAAVNTRADTWAIGLENNVWLMLVPVSQPGNFTGGVVRVDGDSTDAQFGFRDGMALREISTL